MSNTPRTDAETISGSEQIAYLDENGSRCTTYHFVTVEFARQLERENRELAAALRDITDFPPSFFDREDNDTLFISVLGSHLKAARAVLAKVQP